VNITVCLSSRSCCLTAFVASHGFLELGRCRWLLVLDDSVQKWVSADSLLPDTVELVCERSIDQQCHLIVNMLFYWKPVKLTENWHVVAFSLKRLYDNIQ